MNTTIATLRRRASVAGCGRCTEAGRDASTAPVGHQDAGDERVEVRQQLLQAGEVPRRLCRLGREVRVREPSQGRVERDPERRAPAAADAEGDDDVTHEQVRPGEDGVVDAVAPLRSPTRGPRRPAAPRAPAVERRAAARWRGTAGGEAAAVASSAKAPVVGPLDREAVLADPPDVHAEDDDESAGSTATCSA